MEVIQEMAAVGLVLVLFGASLWALKRRGIAGISLPGRPNKKRLECLERMPLGPQHTLHLVRVDGRELLVASSPSGCALLQSLAGNAAEAAR
jgi:flagellar biosynthetic protein FliO